MEKTIKDWSVSRTIETAHSKRILLNRFDDSSPILQISLCAGLLRTGSGLLLLLLFVAFIASVLRCCQKERSSTARNIKIIWRKLFPQTFGSGNKKLFRLGLNLKILFHMPRIHAARGETVF